MAQQAYIFLTDDGVGAEATLLAVGRTFTPGADIREAVTELEAWANENGYEVTTPEYSVLDWSLEDLIEPEIFDDVFGDQDES